MSDLKYAHAGYVYQDLLAAVDSVDLVLGHATQIYCDTRQSGRHDRFDDLTVEWADGTWTRRQIKHQENPQPVDVDTFARTWRSLHLGEVLRGIRADESEYADRAKHTSYTVYLRDSAPIDKVLTAVLIQADPDPGPSVVGTNTVRYRFDAEALWAGAHRPAAGSRKSGDAWEFLRRAEAGAGQADSGAQDEGRNGTTQGVSDADRVVFAREELVHLTERLVVEVNAPAMSSDFAHPGPLELILLHRLRAEVGVGEFPNETRRPEDVAAALVAAAANARLSHEPLTRDGLLKALSIRTDYGSVSRRSPVVVEQQVGREGAVAALRASVEKTAAEGGFVVVEGPPGQGKSWVADQLRTSLVDDGWTVAEHYCFLNDSEEERDDRVASERIFGSLTERIAAKHPALAVKQRPIFSADEQTLMDLVASVIDEGGNRVVLIIDGLDHVTRVHPMKPGSMSASSALTALIAALDPMIGCAIVVLSQPGDHLEPFLALGAESIAAPPMNRGEIASLMERLGIAPGGGMHASSDNMPTIGELEFEAGINSVYMRSAGNPLYATYLCRELQREDRLELCLTEGSMTEILTAIPPYGGDLEGYYAHLAAMLDDAGQAAADTLTLVDFPLSVEELKAIQPGQGHRVAKAVRVLGPVLRTSPRGIAIYHESFARFLRRELEADADAMAFRLRSLAAWLTDLGLFRDARAFGTLLPLLATAGRNLDVLEIVNRSFAAAAVGAGFPPTMVRANLAVAVRCGQREGAWPAVVRCLELMRGLETYEQERIGDLDPRFLEVRLALFGGEQVVDRMLHDEVIVMPAEAGLLLCAGLDKAGFVPPWRPYLRAWREQRGDGDSQPDEAIAAAWFRGQLRLLSTAGLTTQPKEAVQAPSELQEVTTIAPSDFDGSGHDDMGAVEARPRHDKPGSGVAPEPAGQHEPTQREELSESGETHREHLLRMTQQWCDATGSLIRHRIMVEAIADTLGMDIVASLTTQAKNKGLFCLAVAEAMVDAGIDELTPYGIAAGWATQATIAGVPSGLAHQLRLLGVEPSEPADSPDDNEDLVSALETTRAAVENHSPQRAAEFLDAIEQYSARPLLLDAIAQSLNGEGWYQCWLRFCVELIRAETSPREEAGALAMQALNRLTEDVRPFAGNPRAVDLYQEMELIWATIDRAIRLLDADNWQNGIELLLTVGNEITGSIHGEMGVPLPPDRTLRLALSTVPDQHLGTLSGLIRQEINRSNGRFYSDIAEYYLMDSLCHLRRAEVAADVSEVKSPANAATEQEAREQAMASWTEASRTLLAYGWHKDITVFEVLDPLRSLNTLDLTRGLNRMGAAQDLVYRVRDHTDGKETRHAPTQWWRMLAVADPVAHAQFSVELGLDSRGSRTHFEQMRHDLWTAHAASADPVVSAVLAATLPDAPQSRTYVDMLHGLVALELGDLVQGVLQRAVTRGDEITQESSEAHNEEPSEPDILKDINAIAVHHALRRIALAVTSEAPIVSSSGASTNKDELDDNDEMRSVLVREDEKTAVAALELVKGLALSAPPGLAGVAMLVRAWRRQSTGANRGAALDALIESYAAALVDRFVTMIDDGHVSEISTALESLSELSDFGDLHRLLARVGEMLLDLDIGAQTEPEAVSDLAEEASTELTKSLRREVAARALALAWTQARGDGGWLAFGGIDHMPLLAQATALSPEIAAEAVGIGVERLVAGPNYQTMGVTKALIEAFVANALGTLGGESSTDVAFNVWDEAFAVISDRLPILPGEQRLAQYDGELRQPPPMEPTMSATDYALAVASFAGLSHPGRENLRRTIVALEDLARLRPRLFTHALPIALQSMKGALVPLLLLSTLDQIAADQPLLLSRSVDELERLLDSKFLAVRALARRLLSLVADDEPPIASSNLSSYPPLRKGDAAYERFVLAVDLLQETPFRPSAVHDRVDGFVEAVVELIARQMDDEGFGSEMRAALRDMGGRRGWPDAVMLSDHVSEESLHEGAGALRAHLASQGTLVRNAVEWEDDLAGLLKLTRLPLMVERGRIPRPRLPLHPDGTASVGTSPPNDDSNGEREAWADSQAADWVPAPMSDGGPYSGWVLLAYCETIRTKSTRSHGEPDILTHVQAGVELDLSALADPYSVGPLAEVDLYQWLSPRLEAADDSRSRRVPLAAKALPVGPFVDDSARLGLPSMLAPTPELVGTLDLSSGGLKATELVMSDQAGLALAHVTWRSNYLHSDYHMSYPRLAGSGLLLRPDLAAALVERWEHRVTWRIWVGE